MPDGNGHTVKKDKHCPFLNKLCIEEKCALYSELRRNAEGLQQKFGACAFNAVVLILSEINLKTQSPQPQKVQLPQGLFRG